MIRRRAEMLTEAVAGFATRYDLYFVDMFHDQEIRRAGYWSADRLHLNANGHRRVAGLVLTALPADGDVDKLRESTGAPFKVADDLQTL